MGKQGVNTFWYGKARSNKVWIVLCNHRGCREQGDDSFFQCINWISLQPKQELSLLLVNENWRALEI